MIRRARAHTLAKQEHVARSRFQHELSLVVFLAGTQKHTPFSKREGWDDSFEISTLGGA